jgi:hypothetical protein
LGVKARKLALLFACSANHEQPFVDDAAAARKHLRPINNRENLHMKVELWPIGQVKPYDNNPRINDGAVDGVAASIREFGFRQPIVVDTDGVVIAGHTRLKAAHKLGMDKVPVIVATDLTPEQIRAYTRHRNKRTIRVRVCRHCGRRVITTEQVSGDGRHRGDPS